MALRAILAAAVLAVLGALGAGPGAGDAVLPHRHRRGGRHLLPDRRPDRRHHQQPARRAALRQGRQLRRAGAGGDAQWPPTARSPTSTRSSRGELESGFAQSDVAYWAYTGTGIFEGQGKVDNLRAIANLYPESIHVVARKGAGIESVARPHGQARVARRAGLRHAGRCPHHPRGLRPHREGHRGRVHQAAARRSTRSGTASSTPSSSSPAIRPAPWSSWPPSVGVELVPIDGPEVENAARAVQFFARDLIPAGTYKGIGAAPTISVGAQWVVGAKATRSWSTTSPRRCGTRTPARCSTPATPRARRSPSRRALDGIGIPLHPGAERYYREAGLLQ